MATAFASLHDAQQGAEASLDPALTMQGFDWTERDAPAPAPPGEDLWCVRDSFSALMRWPRDSDNWKAFIEAPNPEDVHRLAEHLHLMELGVAPLPWSESVLSEQAHPGIANWEFPLRRSAHATYEADLRIPPMLPPEYVVCGPPDLLGYFVDDRQPPRIPV